MTGSINRRLAVALTLVVAGLLGARRRIARHPRRRADPYLDQCFATAASGPCQLGATGQLGGGMVMHPNQRWIYVSSTGAAPDQPLRPRRTRTGGSPRGSYRVRHT